MIDFLIMGTLLGLSAGFSPGPLLTLVVTETLQHNVRAGIKVALISGTAPLLFIGSFYAMLVGSKVLLAWVAGRSKSLLYGHGYLYTMRFLGLMLCLLALLLFREGVALLSR